jgi:CRP-like cAMP-binding protein
VTFETLRVNYLRGLAGFASYTDDELAQLVAISDECDVAAGEILASEGVPPPQAFLVIEGTGSVITRGRIIGTVRSGELVGADGPSATVTADTPMRLLVMGPAAYRAFVSARGLADRRR